MQAEQILATACENESHNAKRMRLGLEPVSQPMPLLPGAAVSFHYHENSIFFNCINLQPTDTTAPISRNLDFTSSTPVKIENDVGMFPSTTTPSSTPNSVSKGMSLTPDIKSTPLRYDLLACISIFVLTD